jgi:hypothetical protein
MIYVCIYFWGIYIYFFGREGVCVVIGRGKYVHFFYYSYKVVIVALFVDDALCEVTEPDIPQTLIDRLAEER